MKFKFNFRRNKRNLEKAQQYVDESCMEGMLPFIPVAAPYYDNAGKLRDSLKIESPGHLTQQEKFAHHQYYDELDHSASGNPAATRLWFESMKQRCGAEIRANAEKIARRGKK